MERYLKYFTLLSLDSVQSIVEEHTVCLTLLDLYYITLTDHQASPEKRIAQRALADEVTEMVHGGKLHTPSLLDHSNHDIYHFQAEAVKRAQIATQVLFSTDLANVAAGDIVLALQDDPAAEIHLFRRHTEQTHFEACWFLQACAIQQCV